MPEVSVIITTFNRANLVQQAITSVLNQTFTDFELIIIDDGSTDDTQEIVKQFHDPRIRNIWQPNQERSNARNHGIAVSEAPFVTFLDADDIYLPEKLAGEVPILRNDNKIDMVLSGWKEVDGQGQTVSVIRPWIDHPQPVPKDWYYSPLSRIGAFLIRKELLVQIDGFDPRFPPCEDTDLFLRLGGVGVRTDWLKQIVMSRSWHPNNTVGNTELMRNASLNMIKKNFEDGSLASALGLEIHEVFGRMYLGGAGYLFIAGRGFEAQKDLAHAIKSDSKLLLDGYTRILFPLVSYAIKYNISNPAQYAALVFSNLPPSLNHLKKYRTKFIADIWAVMAFNARQASNIPLVRRAALQAFLHHWSWLKNCGLIIIWIKSLIALK